MKNFNNFIKTVAFLIGSFLIFGIIFTISMGISAKVVAMPLLDLVNSIDTWYYSIAFVLFISLLTTALGCGIGYLLVKLMIRISRKTFTFLEMFGAFALGATFVGPQIFAWMILLDSETHIIGKISGFVIAYLVSAFIFIVTHHVIKSLEDDKIASDNKIRL